jgi:N-hydroxyarylamine O-acetyltransferase
LNVKAYLTRIDYHGPTTPSAETLHALQVAHLLCVPFENLSIHAGERIELNDESLFRKIVERRRGGFCYEANGLFAALLRALGFDVSMLSAQVADANDDYGQPFDHMTLIVKLDQRWLVDVGFGDSFTEPLLIDSRDVQVQREDAYRIVESGDYLILVRRTKDGWKPQYRFTLNPYQYEDFEPMCQYHQTSPESHFTQKRICSRPTESGRITLSDMRLIETKGNQRDERVLANEQEYEAILRAQFGIVMPR